MTGVMTRMRHRKVILAITALAILLLPLALKLDFISQILVAGTTSQHLSFLNPKYHPTSPSTTMGEPPPSEYPKPFVHEPTAVHDSTIILLHGTSQDGPSFGEAFLSFPIKDNRTLPQLCSNTRFVFPTGRFRYCTVLGRESHAWFDFVSFSDRTINETSQLPGLQESTRYLARLLESENELLAGRGKVVLGGFSQGTAIACIALLSGELGRLGGFVGMSGWCPFRKQINDAVLASKSLNYERSKARDAVDESGSGTKAAMGYVRQLLDLAPLEVGKGEDGKEVEELLGVKVWLGHGEEDTKMKAGLGRDMAGLLSSIGLDAPFLGYEGLGHWWGEREMVDLSGFLRGLWDERKGEVLMK